MEENNKYGSFEEIEKENKKYLEIFENYLKKKNYKEKTIENHLNRVDYYINDYLMWGLPKHMEAGCSSEVMGFIEFRVNERVIPASVHNIDHYLSSIKAFYKCMVENNIIKEEQFKNFKEDIKYFKDELIEDYYDKNPNIIELKDVIEAIELGHDIGSGYIHIKTGEKEYIPDDDALYDGSIIELFDKLDGPNWVPVPEFRDHDVMYRFARQLDDADKSELLINILHNRKAYRNFKNKIHEMGIEKDYYAYHDANIKQLAEEWLKENVEDYDEDSDIF